MKNKYVLIHKVNFLLSVFIILYFSIISVASAEDTLVKLNPGISKPKLDKDTCYEAKINEKQVTIYFDEGSYVLPISYITKCDTSTTSSSQKKLDLITKPFEKGDSEVDTITIINSPKGNPRGMESPIISGPLK